MRLSKSHPGVGRSTASMLKSLGMTRFEAAGASVVLRSPVFEMLDAVRHFRALVSEGGEDEDAPPPLCCSIGQCRRRPLDSGVAFYRLLLSLAADDLLRVAHGGPRGRSRPPGREYPAASAFPPSDGWSTCFASACPCRCQARAGADRCGIADRLKQLQIFQQRCLVVFRKRRELGLMAGIAEAESRRVDRPESTRARSLRRAPAACRVGSPAMPILSRSSRWPPTLNRVGRCPDASGARSSVRCHCGNRARSTRARSAAARCRCHGAGSM